MPTVREIESLKAEILKLQEERAQAQGALKLYKEKNVSIKDVASVRKELIDLERARVELEEKYTAAMNAYIAAKHARKKP